MSTPETPRTPAGWYPDPEGVPRQRWWDGDKWTADIAPSAERPYSVARPKLTAPAGTAWNTPWIWLALFVPLLPILPLLFVDWSLLVDVDAATLEPDLESQFAVYTSPAYLASVFGGWVTWALAVLFSYLDWRTLRNRGVPSPFHWAWAILSSIVYAIGRGIVTNSRMGSGIAVVWAAVGVIVLGILLGIGIAATVIGAVIEQVPLQ